MPFCPVRKLAFCHIPRTGGVSVSNALEMTVHDKHFKASYYREKFPDFTLFTIIRPYEERIRSAFEYILHTNKIVYENINLMIQPNEYYLDVPVDVVLNFHSLQTDLDLMLRSIGFPPVELVKCNTFKTWI